MINSLKPCKYVFKQDGSNQYGFIADDVMEVIPEAVDGKKYPYWWKNKADTDEPELDDNNELILDETQPRMKGLK